MNYSRLSQHGARRTISVFAMGVAIVASLVAMGSNAYATDKFKVTKTADNASITAGQNASFTISATAIAVGINNTVENFTLQDNLPPGTWTLGGPDATSCGIASNVLTCNFGDVPEGQTRTITVTRATTSDDCGTTISNTATVNSDDIVFEVGDETLDNSSTAMITVGCTPPPPPPCPGGSFTFSSDANGNVSIIFDQFPAPNDNSYGLNAVGWPNGHKFTDLVGSDHAGFQLRDGNGVVRLSFNIDYISADSSAPSGYRSLGPFGGDGKVLVGSLTPADISFTSSLANNLNNINIPGLFNPATHTQLIGSVNALVNSPPTDALHQTYAISDPALAGWDFHDTYFVTITAAKLASLGFNSSWSVEPNLDALHNSPAKPCPPASGGQALSVTKVEVKDKQVKVTVLNSGSVDAIVTAVNLTWPSSNGNLVQVKLDGDVIYDNPDIAPTSANLTTAQLVADQNKRKINHNSSDVLAFIFQNNADTNATHYTGSLTASGVTLTILP
jgi:Domain of unknown function DUF11